MASLQERLWASVKEHQDMVERISNLRMLPPSAMLWSKRACTYSLDLLSRHAPCDGRGCGDFDYYQHKGRERQVICHVCGGQSPCTELEELAEWWDVPFNDD
jgi:hypothetical protein